MPALVNRPELLPDLTMYMEAYGTLARSRPGEGAPERIPFRDIVAVCDLFRVRTVQGRLNMVHAVQTIDAEALLIAKEKAEAEAAKLEKERKAPKSRERRKPPPVEEEDDA